MGTGVASPVKPALMLVNCHGVWRQNDISIHAGSITIVNHDLSELKRCGRPGIMEHNIEIYWVLGISDLLLGAQTEMYRSSAGTAEAALFVCNRHILFITENKKAHPHIRRQQLKAALRVNRSLCYFCRDFVCIITFHLWVELHSSPCYHSNLFGDCLCQLYCIWHSVTMSSFLLW